MIIPPSAITPRDWNQLECYPVSPIPIATLPWSQKMPGSIGKGGHSRDRIATGARNPQTAKTKKRPTCCFFFVIFFFGGGMNVSALVVGSCLVKGFSWKTRWSVQPNVNAVGGGSSLSPQKYHSVVFWVYELKERQFHRKPIDFFFGFSTSNFTFFFSKNTTLPKFNIAPEKSWLEDYFPIRKVAFQGLC